MSVCVFAESENQGKYINKDLLHLRSSSSSTLFEASVTSTTLRNGTVYPEAIRDFIPHAY